MTVNGCPCALVALTEDEQTQCLRYANERMARERLDDFTDLRDRHVVTELVFRALRDRDDLNCRVFPSARLVDESLTDLEVTYLAERWHALVTQQSPVLRRMSHATYERWIDLLIEGGRNTYNFHMLQSADDPASYFGCPISRLTDGQKLALFAVRAHADKERQARVEREQRVKVKDIVNAS